MTHLPTELVVRFLELSYLAEDGSVDRSTLKSCSLVCRFWRDPAQQLLFRSGLIYRRRAEDFQRLKEIFEANPLLGSFVRSISISVSDKTLPGRGAFTAPELVQILSFFPNLYHLQLSSFNPTSDNNVVFTFELQEDLVPRHIRSLTFSTSARDSELLYYFLTLWPSIEFLTIASVSLRALPLTQPTFHLKQLTYNDPPSLEALTWLVPNHTLRYLHLTAGFDQYEGDKEISYAFLQREGAYLRSLRLYSIEGPNLGLLALCPNLEELDVEYMDLGVPGGVLEVLPRGLEHLHVRNITAWGSVALRDMVRVLPRLRVLTVPDGAKLDLARHWVNVIPLEMFERECGLRGVEVVYEAAQRFPGLVSLRFGFPMCG
jgi:hypothetical protein